MGVVEERKALDALSQSHRRLATGGRLRRPRTEGEEAEAPSSEAPEPTEAQGEQEFGPSPST